MTTVSRVGLSSNSVRPSGTRAGGAGFRLPDAGGRTDGANALSPAAAVDTALGLLGVQAMGDALERDRRARRDGLAILGDLRSLQLGMLAGSDVGRVLDRLAQISPTEAADPALREIVEEVRLRAKVEVARHEAIRQSLAKRAGQRA